jgi:hypothetical protein
MGSSKIRYQILYTDSILSFLNIDELNKKYIFSALENYKLYFALLVMLIP